MNLITNSLQAMPGGGSIRIAAREDRDCALIEVEDSGPGVPGEIYDRLFDPSLTAGKKDGLGLGLAPSRQTVLDRGGEMWLEPADGARSVMRLPLSRVLTTALERMPQPKGLAAAVNLIRSVFPPCSDPGRGGVPGIK